jgi:hypothetical protein
MVAELRIPFDVATEGLVRSARETWPNLFTEQLQRFRTFAWPRMT